jgi:hypothetical protein
MSNLEVLQEWLGHIVSIDKKKNTFYSILSDITNGGTDEEIELKFSDVNENEFHLIREGAIFDLKILRENCTNCNGIVSTSIKFHEAKELTEEDYKRAEEWANKMSKAFE